MTHQTRTLHPACCPKCQGTDWMLSPGGLRAEKCDHTQRTDVTGLTDDEERILDLERHLSSMAASCEAEAAKARAKAFECALEHHERILSRVGTWKVKGANDAEEWGEIVRDDCEWRRELREEIRALKGKT